MFSIREIFELGEQLERNGRRFYVEAQAKFLDPALASLLGWLVEEEVKHEEWFAQKKKAMAQAAATDPMSGDMGNSILREVLGDQTFSLKEADLAKIERLQDLLDLALEFERDTILFFEMVQAFLEDQETLNGLKKIIEEERHHIRSIEAYGEGVLAVSKVH